MMMRIYTRIGLVIGGKKIIDVITPDALMAKSIIRVQCQRCLAEEIISYRTMILREKESKGCRLCQTGMFKKKKYAVKDPITERHKELKTSDAVYRVPLEAMSASVLSAMLGRGI